MTASSVTAAWLKFGPSLSKADDFAGVCLVLNWSTCWIFDFTVLRIVFTVGAGLKSSSAASARGCFLTRSLLDLSFLGSDAIFDDTTFPAEPELELELSATEVLSPALAFCRFARGRGDWTLGLLRFAMLKILQEMNRV